MGISEYGAHSEEIEWLSGTKRVLHFERIDEGRWHTWGQMLLVVQQNIVVHLLENATDMSFYNTM